MKRFLMTFFYFLIAVIFVLGILRLTPLWESTIVSAGNPEAFDFNTGITKAKENHYLICTEGQCNNTAHAAAPMFNISPEELSRRIDDLLKSDSSVISVEKSETGYVVLARTSLMRWPDWIDIQIIPISDTETSLAIYSRSVYGKKDFGANKARALNWLNSLN